MFHFGTLLFMDIVFAKHVLINGMLFVMSPFALGRFSFHYQLVSIPVLGDAYSLFVNRTLRSSLLKPRHSTAPHRETSVASKT
jgi:hypothetical protein